MPVIDTHNLTKYYGKTRGIENLNLSVEEGEIFGFIGPNGAGKSTAIRTLLTLIFPTSGSATVLGYDIIQEAKPLKREVGYLPSEVHFYDNMSVKELLRYSADFFNVTLDDRYRRLVEQFEVDTSRNLKDLSSGNKKKVGIIQALLHRPKLLILDEPTNGLDPLMQNVFFDVLREENDQGTTIFFSSHILSEVQRFCKRVAVIRDGQIVATEAINELRKKQLKHCWVMLDVPAEASQFELDGIENLKVHNHTASFSYSGPPDHLLKHIGELPVKNVNIEDPPLEEVFIHYYQRAHDQ